MSELIIREIAEDIKVRLLLWLKQKRKVLERMPSPDHKHDGKRVYCHVCTKILMLDELIMEIEEE